MQKLLNVSILLTLFSITTIGFNGASHTSRGCSCSERDPFHRISLYVFNKDYYPESIPIQGAEVIIKRGYNQFIGTTNSSGRVRHHKTSGWSSYTVSKSGFLTESGDILIGERRLRFEVWLTPY